MPCREGITTCAPTRRIGDIYVSTVVCSATDRGSRNPVGCKLVDVHLGVQVSVGNATTLYADVRPRKTSSPLQRGMFGYVVEWGHRAVRRFRFRELISVQYSRMFHA